MNILVTGANGQLGGEIKNLVNIIGNGHKDHTSSEKNYYIFAGRDTLDITDEDSVMSFISENKINVVVNCAAYTAVDKAEDDFENACKINVNGPMNLAKACEKMGAVLIHISTDYVFDGTANTPLSPSSNTNPQSVYGTTKRMGELSIMENSTHYIIIRTSWLYSALSENNFVAKMFKLVQSKDEMKVVYDQVGCLTDAADLASLVYKIIEEHNDEHPYLCRTGLYHYCDGGVTSWYDVTASIANYLRNQNVCDKVAVIKPCTSDEFPTKAKRPHYSVLDTKSAQEAFDFTPNYWRDNLLLSLYKMLMKKIKLNINE